jgi:hypothetical protein
MTALDGWREATTLVAVVTSGLIAGQMLAIGLANFADRAQAERDWTRRFRLENALFTRTMPVALIVPMIGLVVCCILTEGYARGYFVAASAALAVVLAITMAANVPINTEVGSWEAGAAPDSWMLTRDRWLAFHWARTVFGTLAFILAAVALHQP